MWLQRLCCLCFLNYLSARTNHWGSICTVLSLVTSSNWIKTLKIILLTKNYKTLSLAYYRTQTKIQQEGLSTSWLSCTNDISGTMTRQSTPFGLVVNTQTQKFQLQVVNFSWFLITTTNPTLKVTVTQTTLINYWLNTREVLWPKRKRSISSEQLRPTRGKKHVRIKSTREQTFYLLTHCTILKQQQSVYSANLKSQMKSTRLNC